MIYLYETVVEKLLALHCIQRLSCPNVALQRALSGQLLNH